MDTIYILNNFRTSFLADPRGIQILALLYLRGESKEELISEELNMNKTELNAILAKYFGSKLIKRNKDNQWYLSSFSKHSIFKTKIAEAINDSLIDNFKISEKDKKILKIFINFDFDHNPYYLNTCHLYHHYNLNDLYVKNDETKEDFIQSLYSVIFGLNPFLKNHKAEDFLNFILTQNTSESLFLNKYKDYFTKRLNESKVNIKQNNGYIIYPTTNLDPTLARHSLISSSRLYCSIERDLLDDDLKFYLKLDSRVRDNLVRTVFNSNVIGDYFRVNIKLQDYLPKHNSDLIFNDDSIIEFTSKAIINSYHNNLVNDELKNALNQPLLIEDKSDNTRLTKTSFLSRIIHSIKKKINPKKK